MRLAAAALALLVCSCRESAPSGGAVAAATAAETPRASAITASSSSPPAPSAAPQDPEKFGQGKRWQDSAVYIDGRVVAVLKHSELPLSLKSRILWDDFPMYRVAEYLQAIGVNLSKIREVHFYGGSRQAIITGAELIKFKDKLMFAFTQADRGKPRMEWPEGGGLKVNTHIDIIGALVVYQEKEPPTIHQTRREMYLAFADGKKIEGIPYVPAEENIKGTRVYVDGVLTGAAKRKTLPSDFQLPNTDAAPRFELVPYLKSLGVRTDGLRSVDFISGDDTIARIGPKAWKDVSAGLVFSLPRRNKGQMTVHFPPSNVPAPAAPDGGAPEVPNGGQVRVSAITVYRRLSPPERVITPFEDEGSAQSEPRPQNPVDE
jgi:hypothetical protein